MSASDESNESKDQPNSSYREQLQGRNVIVVEDELFISMELEMSLEDCGVKVVGPYANIEQVLDVADELDADVAILDVNLNGIMVFPVADLLLKRGIPFVFHTGNAKSEELLTRYPGVRVIKKPADIPELLKQVAGLLPD